MTSSAGLSAADRLAALRRTGLTAEADPAFDRFAGMVRQILNVPVALVTLVEADRQIFPGAHGLGSPWQEERQTPLSHSFCQHVVLTGEPLIVTDARLDPRVADNLAITELEVVGYAGMPLTDADGLVLGSLCAIDTAPREWTPEELRLLADLAAACSDSLRLRVANWHAQLREMRAGAAFDRSQLLLRASVALANTTTAQDVVAAVRDLVTGTLDPAYVGLSLLDAGGRVLLQTGDLLPGPVAGRWGRYPVSAGTPSALAARTGVLVMLADLDAVAAAVPDALATFVEMGWQSAASAPLPSAEGSVGALTFVWKQPNTLTDDEKTVLAALAGYVAQALHRADYLSSRENVATVLQRAMLTDLPDPAPFELAALYQPAARGEQVGGDWYDVIRLDPDHLTLAVGDVAGHDISAAARMGQLRNMLRAYLVDRHEPPSALLRRLDAANQVLGEPTLATAFLGYVRPDAAPNSYRLLWSNAGHPAPLLVETTGKVTELTGRDTMLGVRRRTPRTNHNLLLPPGSTLLVHTDGLIETRARPFGEREAELKTVLAGLADIPLADLLPELLARIAGTDHEDDVAMLALRTPPR